MANTRQRSLRPRVVLVEDDRWESNYVKGLIEKAFPSRATVEQLYTEADFHSAMKWIRAQPPAVVIMDIALPLGDIDLSNLGVDASDVEGDGKDAVGYKAGLRCLRLLREAPETRQVPVILHTIYTRENFPDMPAESGNLLLITKEQQYGRLIKATGSFLALAGSDIAVDQGIAAISPRTPPIERSIFVVMPFNRAHIDTLEARRRAVSKAGKKLRTIRIDERPGAFPVVTEIMAAIQNANLVVCDLTDERPNVYFELGFAKGGNKPVICIAHAGTTLHFDVAGFNTLFFETFKELEERLAKEIKLTLLDLNLGVARHRKWHHDMHLQFRRK